MTSHSQSTQIYLPEKEKLDSSSDLIAKIPPLVEKKTH